MENVYQQVTKLSPEERELLEMLLQQEGVDTKEMILPAERTSNALPLSLTQQRLWATGEFAPDTAFGNVPMAFEVAGALDAAALEKSLNEIVRRHEILRTTFQAVNGHTMQVVAPDAAVSLRVIDLQDVPADERHAEAVRRAKAAARRPFDWAREPLLRATLLQLDAEASVLVIVMNHLVTDGWSARVFLRELSALYRGFAPLPWRGAPPDLPEPPIQYADWAVWQRDWLQGEVLETQVAYWKAQLDGAPPQLELPFDRPRPLKPSFQSAVASFALSPTLSESLRALGRREGVTLYTLLLAAWKTLLQRYSLADEIVVGTTISNRNRRETEGLIGNLGNNLLLRTDLGGDPTFREVLDRVQEVTIAAYEHQDLPLEKLIEALQAEGEGHRVPLFQMMFVLRESDLEQNLALPGLTLRSIPLYAGWSALDMILDVTDGEAGLSGSLEYKTDLFDAATIEELLAQFEALLEMIAADPARRLSTLPVLARPELPAIEPSETPPRADRTKIAPRDAVEAQLVEIWEKVLAVRPVAITDSFFELGGHSLLAGHLFEQIERRFGKRLPLATLLQAPTVEGLAEVLRRENGAASWSPLVPIQTRGSRPPLFCIHAESGNVLGYYELAQHLGPGQPVYGLQAEGLNGRQVGETGIPEMAARYIEALRSVQATGPYYLGGYCLGGLIALEMAQQLRAQGEEVALVGMIECPLPDYATDFVPRTTRLHRLAYRLAARIDYERSNLAELTGRGRVTYLLNRARRVMTIFQVKAEKAIAALLARFDREVEPSRARVLETLAEKHEQAYVNYEPRPYPGRVALFRASQQPLGIHPDPTLGWSELVEGNLEVRQVPAYHGNILLGPRARVLAEGLKAALDEAQTPMDGDQDGRKK